MVRVLRGGRGHIDDEALPGLSPVFVFLGAWYVSFSFRFVVCTIPTVPTLFIRSLSVSTSSRSPPQEEGLQSGAIARQCGKGIPQVNVSIRGVLRAFEEMWGARVQNDCNLA